MHGLANTEALVSRSRALVLLAVSLALHAGAAGAADQDAVAARRAASGLFQAYSKETAPYFPFNATQAGAHQYDGLLANNLTAEYRAGLASLCARYRDHLHAIDKSKLDRDFQLSVASA